MVNLEWEVPHTIVSPLGSVDLNVPDDDGRVFQIVSENYKIIPSLRVTQDNISQADGSILHPRWKTGLVATMRIEFHVKTDTEAGYRPACQQDLREMSDLLALNLNAMRTLSTDANSNQRLLWTPTGYTGGNRRMLTYVQVLSWPDPQFDASDNQCSVDLALETPFPYAIDLTEIDTPPSGSDSSATVTNDGTAVQSPVIKVFGPTSGFTLQNADDLDAQGNPKAIVYDSSRPGGVAIGGSQYAEIDFFRGSIFLNGDVSDLIANLDPVLTDFFGLVPGDNDITIDDGTFQILSNAAWA